MKFTNITLISLSSLLMVACGGGGGESSTPDPVLAVVEVPVAVVVTPPLVTEIIEPDPNAIYDTTAELIVSKSFLLKQEYELTVSYKNDDNRNAYLSVCTDFTDGEEGIKVNYNSCLLRTSIESDYAGTLTIANDKNRLVMAIWYFDDTKNPRYEVWENDDDTKAVRMFVVN
ncbi:hypothetical protein [Colwellia sp. 12G3]|uniref:hypothetical protein n=1 Tax=Colwellia sp. 12G3 TaxID=2058299 RepID=UPI000C343F75|nr:hypothetical protein [Colwellia sp. 12G3]PKI16554.1 hypothetical protein CXF71_08095 [Colwellia sp. 12G3]